MAVPATPRTLCPDHHILTAITRPANRNHTGNYNKRAAFAQHSAATDGAAFDQPAMTLLRASECAGLPDQRT